MLSNFASRKSEKDGIPASAGAEGGQGAAANPMMPPRPEAPAPMRAPPERTMERSQPSVIGPDLTIQGNLTSKGEVQVDGEVQGDVYASHVVVGERARINGGIMAQEIVVRGHVVGFVRGIKVMLQASSHVEGDVLHKSLAIEQGAYFEGKSRRSESPLQDQAAALRDAEPAPAASEAHGGDAAHGDDAAAAPRPQAAQPLTAQIRAAQAQAQAHPQQPPPPPVQS